jgi:GT2 family glycosyltransferase
MEHAAAGEGPIALSVIVCTYNRCRKLERSLRAIASSVARGNLAAEIVVVDNNSRDGTEAVVREFALSCPVPVRRVVELSQGLSYARNRGIREAKGDIVAFTDDDCVVDPGWVAAIAKEFAEIPEIMVVGGRVDLYTPEDRPVTIRPIDKRVRYTSTDQIYTYIIGANMAFRRRLVERIGWFDPALAGSRGAGADDIDFIYRALRSGAGVIFVPDVKVLHDHGRRTDEQVRALERSYVKGRGAFYCKHALGDHEILKHLYWELRTLAHSRDGKVAGSIAAHLWILASGALHLMLTRAGLLRD